MSDLRMSGLATGLDTNGIIEQLMSIERRPVKMIENNKALEATKLERLRALNTKFLALEASAKSLMGTSFNLSSFSAKKFASSDAAVFTVSGDESANVNSYDIKVNQLARSQQQGGNAFNAAHDAGTLRIDGPAGIADINFGANDSAQSIANQINANVLSGMNASVVSGKLVLNGKNSGAAETYAISMTAGIATLDDLGLQATGAVASQDAAIEINGIGATSATNTFTNVVQGVNITAVSVYNPVGAGKTLTVSANQDEMVNKVKDLVAKYNDIITQISADSKYNATTKKAGPLTGDSFVTGLTLQMNRMLTQAFDTNAAGNAGLTNSTTIGIAVSRDGTLTLDEAKLRTKLGSNPNEVYQLLAREDGTNAVPGVKANVAGSAGVQGDGIANRLRAFANSLVSATSDYNYVQPGGGRFDGGLRSRISQSVKAGTNFDQRIEQYDRRLELRERALRVQFTAMEKSVSRLRNQGNYLAGQMSGMGNQAG